MRPGYKQTEVGVIPDDWEIREVREFARVITGPFGTLLKASEYSESDGVPLISVGEIGDGYFRIGKHTPTIPSAVVRRLPQYLLCAGDVVFGRKGAVDRSALVSGREHGWFLGSDGICIRPASNCYSPYLAAQFRGANAKAWLVQNAIGTTMASLNQGVLARAKIPFAPLPEQSAIATALSDVDALLSSLDALIAKKRDIKQAAMQQLLTGKTRLPGFDVKWEVRLLGELAEIDDDNLSAATDHAFAFRYISLEDVDEGRLVGHSEQIFASAPSRARRRIGRGDILVSTVRPNLRSHLHFGESGVDWVCSTGFSVVRCKEGIADAAYVFANLFSAGISRQIDTLLTGSNYPAINGKDVKQLQIPYPPIEEQAAIAQVLSDMDAELAALEARRDKTRLLKQGMMQELLTGKTRLV
jgi:type I restriction enzyme S subunit